MGDLLDLDLYMEAIMRIQYSDPYYTTKPEATFFWSIRPWDKTGFIILKSSNLRPVRSRSDAPKSRLSGWLLPHHSCIIRHFECRSRVVKSHLFCISFLLFFCRSIICLWLNIHSVLYNVYEWKWNFLLNKKKILTGRGYEPLPSDEDQNSLAKLRIREQGTLPWVWRLRPLGHPDSYICSI